MLPLWCYVRNVYFACFHIYFLSFFLSDTSGHFPSGGLHSHSGVAAGAPCGVVPHLALLPPPGGLLHPSPAQFRPRSSSFWRRLRMEQAAAQPALVHARVQEIAKSHVAAHCKT